VPGAGDEEHVHVVFFDHAIQVDVNKVQPRRRAPVAEQARLDMLRHERLLQQRIIVEINLPDRQVVRRAPIGVNFRQQFGLQCFHIKDRE
jgi:hypothetical protein